MNYKSSSFYIIIVTHKYMAYMRVAKYKLQQCITLVLCVTTGCGYCQKLFCYLIYDSVFDVVDILQPNILKPQLKFIDIKKFKFEIRYTYNKLSTILVKLEMVFFDLQQMNVITKFLVIYNLIHIMKIEIQGDFFFFKYLMLKINTAYMQ